MRRAAAVAAGVAGLLALGACQPAAGDEADFGKRVRAYLLTHPEVIQEAAEKLQVKMESEAVAAQQKAQALLPGLRAAVERDPRDFVANPGGKITVTEFYDYRCPHCANAAPKVIALIKAYPDVRFVFKEMPIFGPTSEHAARAALAVKKAGGDYLATYQALMRTRALDDAAIDRIARAAGAKPAELAKNPAADRQLADTSALFSKLALGGTPAFIVGGQIIYGEDMDAVNAAIVKARGRGS